MKKILLSLAVWLTGLAGLAAEAPKLEEQAGDWRISATGYEAAVAKGDGCLYSLKLKGGEFFAAGVGVSRGSYFYRHNRVFTGNAVAKRDDHTLVVSGEDLSLAYDFAADKMTWTMQSNSDAGTALVIVFDKGVTAVSDGKGKVLGLPANLEWKESRWLGHGAVLALDAGSRLFGPWGNGNEVWLLNLPAKQPVTLTLSVVQPTAEEIAKLAGAPAAPGAPGAAAATPAPAAPAATAAPGGFAGPPLSRVRVEERYLQQVPTLQETPDAAVEGLKSFYFEGPEYHGKPTRVFAYYAAPAVKPGEKVPAMVLAHGGVGTAYASWVKLWVARGYAAIAMDLCGSIPVRAGTGTDWKRITEGAGPPGWQNSFGQVGEALPDQWPYYAVNALARARTLIGSFPEVDNHRVGLTGISWGAVLTCIAAGVDPRYVFAAPVYGCGYLYDNSAMAKGLRSDPQARWARCFDPSLYLSEAKMPLLWVAGTNDRFFPLDSLAKSRRQVGQPAALSIKLRLTHSQDDGARPAEIAAFADRYCKGGNELTQVLAASVDVTGTARLNYRGQVQQIELLYTKDSSRAYVDWPWESLKLPPGDVAGQASVALPAGTRYWFFNLTDDRGLIVSSTPEEVRQ